MLVQHSTVGTTAHDVCAVNPVPVHTLTYDGFVCTGSGSRYTTAADLTVDGMFCVILASCAVPFCTI